MQTALDCLPCLVRQALRGARAACESTEGQEQVMREALSLLPRLNLRLTPPELSGEMISLISKNTGVIDPYAKEKKLSRILVEAELPKLRESIQKAKQPLRRATELAVAGNIIDFGAVAELDVGGELARFEERLAEVQKDRFDFESFEAKLHLTRRLLLVGDNVGEHLFDRLLLETIREQYPQIEIHYATRSAPILNDVTLFEAKQAGLDKVAKLIESGSHIPGTPLAQCSPAFIELWQRAVIVSKGQGNYETLNDEPGPIFFLLMAKCPLVAHEIGCNVGDVLLLPPQQRQLL